MSQTFNSDQTLWQRLSRLSWLGALIAVAALWLLAGAVTGQLSFCFILANATIAAFLALAGAAQMTVIASGPGNFDLSLPYIVTFIFSSSTGVYGKIEDPPEETAPFNWHTLPPALILYSGSKIVGEGLCRLYLQQHGLGYAALRYGNLYGENQHNRAIDATRVVIAWERIRAGLPPVIEGDGTQVTNFVYIGDVARAKVANPTVRKIGLSVAKAKRDLGWEPLVGIEEGMRRLVTWLDADKAKAQT